MVEQVQELIDKIQSEGIEAAEHKASEIETSAQQKADEIIKNANQHCEQLIDKAKAEAKKINESTHAALKQASRDMLLKLREKIDHMLTVIISQEVGKALTPDQLAEIISQTVKGYLKDMSGKGDVKVYLSDSDLSKLSKGMSKKLQDQVKYPITFQSDRDIEKGFTISFDGGKSCFDFSDSSLVEYLSTYLNAELASLLSEAASA